MVETKAMSRDAEDMIEQMTAKAGPDAIFGDAVTSGERSVIPVARLAWGGGGGMGSGAAGGAETESTTEEEMRGEGEGMGFGFGVRARPIGYIELTPEAATYKPIIDWGMLAIVGAVVSGLFAITVAARR